MDVAPYKKPPIQDAAEHNAFIKILVDEGVRSYLEIGSMYGASLWKVANALPKGARIVSVDSLIDRPQAKSSLQACIAELIVLGYDAHWICGDSIAQATIEQARFLGPYGALFIDGDHSPGYVLADWKNYGPMATIVGFHDINWNDTWKSARGNTPDASRMGAPKIWQDIKNGYRHREFKLYPPQNYYGIGVLWR